MIRGIHPVSLSTRNFEGLLHFYRDLLGLPFATSYDWQRGCTAAVRVVGLTDSAVRTALLKAGNTVVEIFEYLHPLGVPPLAGRRACDAGITHICFDVSDVIGEYTRWCAVRVGFHTAPLDIGGVVRTPYGRDPDGNIFELQEVITAGLPLHLATLVPGLTPARGPST